MLECGCTGIKLRPPINRNGPTMSDADCDKHLQQIGLPWALGRSWRLVMEAGQPMLVGPASEAETVFPRGKPGGAQLRYGEGSDQPLIVVPVVRCRALLGHTELTLPPPVLRPELEGQPDRRIPLVRRQQDVIRRVVNATDETDRPRQTAAFPEPAAKPRRSTNAVLGPRSDTTTPDRFAVLAGASLTLLTIAGVVWLWFE